MNTRRWSIKGYIFAVPRLVIRRDDNVDGVNHWVMRATMLNGTYRCIGNASLWACIGWAVFGRHPH